MNDSFVGGVVAALPVVLLIGGLFYFMYATRRGKNTRFQDQYMIEMKRQADALERIANSLEKN